MTSTITRDKMSRLARAFDSVADDLEAEIDQVDARYGGHSSEMMDVLERQAGLRHLAAAARRDASRFPPA